MTSKITRYIHEYTKHKCSPKCGFHPETIRINKLVCILKYYMQNVKNNSKCQSRTYTFMIIKQLLEVTYITCVNSYENPTNLTVREFAKFVEFT